MMSTEQITADFSISNRDSEPLSSNDLVAEGEQVIVTRVVTEEVEAEFEPTLPAETASEEASSEASSEVAEEMEAMEEEMVAGDSAADTAESEVLGEEGPAAEEPTSQAIQPAATMAAPANDEDSDDEAGEPYPSPTLELSIVGEDLVTPALEEPDIGAAEMTTVPEPQPVREPLSGLRVAQYVLGTALLVFIAVLLLFRRRWG